MGFHYILNPPRKTIIFGNLIVATLMQHCIYIVYIHSPFSGHFGKELYMSRGMRFPTMCDQQKLRSACAYAQTDQSLCWSLKYFMTVKLLTEPHLRFLSFKGGCTGSSESTFVKMPHCWKSRVVAQLSLLTWYRA